MFDSIFRMSDGFPAAQIARAARLARLALSAGELQIFAAQLPGILAYVDQIQAVDTAGVEPLAHPHPGASVERADDVGPSLDREALLDSAPEAERAAGLFTVPRVLGP